MMGVSVLAQNQSAAANGADRVPDPGESMQTRDIGYWRHRINGADRRLIGLLNERVDYVSQLIPLKAKANRAIRDPKREAEVLAKLKALNKRSPTR